jgi:hypothetical protein
MIETLIRRRRDPAKGLAGASLCNRAASRYIRV